MADNKLSSRIPTPLTDLIVQLAAGRVLEEEVHERRLLADAVHADDAVVVQPAVNGELLARLVVHAGVDARVNHLHRHRLASGAVRQQVHSGGEGVHR